MLSANLIKQRSLVGFRLALFGFLLVVMTGCSLCQDKLITIAREGDGGRYFSLSGNERSWIGQLKAVENPPPPNRFPYNFVIVNGNQEIPVALTSYDDIQGLLNRKVIIIGKFWNPKERDLIEPPELIAVRTIQGVCN